MRKAALLFFALGMAVILAVAATAEPLPVLLGELDNYGGRIVQVSGHIVSASGGEHSFVEINDGTASGKVVFFGKNVTFQKGELACFVGKASLYRGEVEVVGERVC